MSAQKYKYAYVSLFTMLLLLFVMLHFNRIKQIESTQQLIVYNASPIVIAVEQGRDLTLITDSSLYAMNTTEQMRKRLFLNVDTEIYLSNDSVFSFKYDNKNWLVVKKDILQHKEFRGRNMDMDYLLYATTWRDDYSELFKLVKPKVLAMRKMSKSSRQKLQHAAAEYDVELVDVSKSAFILDISNEKQQ